MTPECPKGPESEARQHTVRIEPYRETMWDAYCVTLGCGQHRSGSLKQAQDWKDQHEADTLRPSVESPNHQANQHDEGRPSGSEQLAPQPMVLSNVIAQLSEARDEWQAMADEHRGMGWPEQANGVLLPSRFSDQLSEALLKLVALRPGAVAACSCSPVVVSIHQSTGDCWDAQYQPIHELIEAALDKAHQAGMEELAYGSASHAGDVVLKLLDLLSEDAAQAARSVATPRVWAEVDLQPCPEDVRQVRDCNNFVWRRLVNDQWITGSQGDGPCGWPYLIKKFGPLTEVPSPSLRKEGEDT